MSPDTGEAGITRYYPDTGEPEPRVLEEPVVLAPVVPEEEVGQEQAPVDGPAWLKTPANEPPWLTAVYTIFGFILIALLLCGLWAFIRS